MLIWLMQMSAAVLHFCSAGMDVGGGPQITSKYMNFDLYVKIGIQIQLIYLGGGSYIHFSKNSRL
jgi:hypothetical protein